MRSNIYETTPSVALKHNYHMAQSIRRYILNISLLLSNCQFPNVFRYLVTSLSYWLIATLYSFPFCCFFGSPSNEQARRGAIKRSELCKSPNFRAYGRLALTASRNIISIAPKDSRYRTEWSHIRCVGQWGRTESSSP